MRYADTDSLADVFRTTYWVIQQQTDGLTHADSLRQLPFRGNCLNWVLGHILASRSRVLEHLGQEPLWDEDRIACYARDSSPVTDGQDAVAFGEMLSDLARSQEQILAGLAAISTQELERTVPWGQGERPVAWVVGFLAWHETYHTGQLEYLRQLAGKNDAVI